jgi:programmed cell death protein 5
LAEVPREDASAGAAQANAAKAQAEERRLLREHVLRMVLTSEARQRLTNVRMVRPEIAQTLEDQIIQLATTGKIKRALGEEDIKQFLATLQQPKREFKIRWA